jgi:imidazolonepropionase-like amidohydrolase
LLLCALPAAAQSLTAVRFGKLWDGAKVIDRAVVLVENGRIRSVQAGDAPIPAGASVVDWSRFYGLPGLIDVHTHMTYIQRGGNRLPAVTVFLAQENARKTLQAGVTTVRDLGASDYNDVAMRDLIHRGAMPGPRMFVSGYGLSIPRGGQSSPGTAGTPDEVRLAVRRQIAAGADVIKLYGSLGSFDSVDTQQTFTFDEMQAAVDVAHTMGRKVAIHSYGPEGARDAVRAGADSLEHAVDLDDETLSEMVRRKTFYVPTIDHNRYYVDAAAEYGFRPAAVEGLNRYIARNLETAKRAVKAGVRFAMGSDAVYSGFGQNTRELAWFVKAGMTPEQALRVATANGAELLGQQADLGDAIPGKFADLIAVEGDPLADIDVVITKVRGVMKGGVVVVTR